MSHRGQPNQFNHWHCLAGELAIGINQTYLPAIFSCHALLVSFSAFPQSIITPMSNRRHRSGLRSDSESSDRKMNVTIVRTVKWNDAEHRITCALIPGRHHGSGCCSWSCFIFQGQSTQPSLRLAYHLICPHTQLYTKSLQLGGTLETHVFCVACSNDLWSSEPQLLSGATSMVYSWRLKPATEPWQEHNS